MTAVDHFIITEAQKLLNRNKRTADIKVDGETRLQTSLSLDSLDLMDLVMKIEEEFKVSIPGTTYMMVDEFDTPAQMADVVLRLLKGA